jgi:hypothetical protein
LARAPGSRMPARLPSSFQCRSIRAASALASARPLSTRWPQQARSPRATRRPAAASAPAPPQPADCLRPARRRPAPRRRRRCSGWRTSSPRPAWGRSARPRRRVAPPPLIARPGRIKVVASLSKHLHLPRVLDGDDRIPDRSGSRRLTTQTQHPCHEPQSDRTS